MRLWDASFRMFAMASDCDSSWSSCRAGWGQRLHGACQDWANTKAAYRFFGNDRISEANILAGHFASTRERFAARGGFPILVLQDTTEISFKREDGREVSNALRQPGATSISHQLRHIDAFQPGGYSQWFAAGTGGDQVLEQR